MGRNLIKLIFLIILFSCTKEQEKSIQSLLKENYANLELNNFEHKTKVIENLSRLNNLQEIILELNQLNDGHVFVVSKNSKALNYFTDLEFIPGTNIIASCQESCRPSLLGKYKIVKIDSLSPEEFYLQNSKYVFASTEWGRRHRTFQLLQESRDKIQHKIEVVDIKGKKSQVVLQNLAEKIENKKCVFGKRLDEKTFYLNINSFWCDLNGRLTEEKNILQRFSDEWNEQIKKINDQDRIVLDLRENNGGGDHEVMYVLNTFFDKKIHMYRYQYLRSNITSKREMFKNLFVRKDSKWGKVEDDYSSDKFTPIKKLIKNEIRVLTSPGCFSSCEGIVGMLKINQRAIVYGLKTHGGAGDPKFFKVKNSDWMINIPTLKVWLANGDQIEGIGVSPNIEMRDQFKLSSDEVLEQVSLFK